MARLKSYSKRLAELNQRVDDIEQSTIIAANNSRILALESQVQELLAQISTHEKDNKKHK